MKNKGRVRTIKPDRNTYIRICYDGKGVHRGELHKNKVNVSLQSYTCNKCKNKTTKRRCWIHRK